MRIDDPLWIEVAPKGKPRSEDYIAEIQALLDPKVQNFVLVILRDKNLKPKIKATLDKMSVVS